MEERTRDGVGLGRVLPALLTLVLVVDVATRLLPIEPFTFRPWEAMARFRLAGEPFERNRSCTKEHVSGDLANVGNLPDRRLFHRERFSTDGNGFRNPPDAFDRPFTAILSGDSFSVGAGLDDDDTFARQISRSSAVNVYSAAGIPLGAEDVIALADRLHLVRGTLVHQYVDREDPPAPGSRDGARLRVTRLVPPALLRARAYVMGFLTVAPLPILAGRLVRRLQDDVVLPNRSRGRVLTETLPNGDWMLQLPADAEGSRKDRPVDGSFWEGLRAELAPRGIELLVVLVPTKYTVYGRHSNGGDYLRRLADDLRRRNVPVLDLAPPMLAEARRLLPRRRYLYRRDDTHWSPDGVALAAAAVRERLVRGE